MPTSPMMYTCLPQYSVSVRFSILAAEAKVPKKTAAERSWISCIVETVDCAVGNEEV